MLPKLRLADLKKDNRAAANTSHSSGVIGAGAARKAIASSELARRRALPCGDAGAAGAGSASAARPLEAERKPERVTGQTCAPRPRGGVLAERADQEATSAGPASASHFKAELISTNSSCGSMKERSIRVRLIRLEGQPSTFSAPLLFSSSRHECGRRDRG